MIRIPVYQVSVPQYHVKKAPDHVSIGLKLDTCIKRHFVGMHVAIRCIGSQEHKKKSVEDLIRIIKRLGHDRYDPSRMGDRYQNVQKKHIDFFALDFKIKRNGKYMHQFIESFYTWPKLMRGKPVRLDLAIVYDITRLKRVTHRYEGRSDVKRDGFVFKDHSRKKDAILGIVKIL